MCVCVCVCMDDISGSETNRQKVLNSSTTHSKRERERDWERQTEKCVVWLREEHCMRVLVLPQFACSILVMVLSHTRQKSILENPVLNVQVAHSHTHKLPIRCKPNQNQTIPNRFGRWNCIQKDTFFSYNHTHKHIHACIHMFIHRLIEMSHMLKSSQVAKLTSKSRQPFMY